MLINDELERVRSITVDETYTRRVRAPVLVYRRDATLLDAAGEVCSHVVDATVLREIARRRIQCTSHLSKPRVRTRRQIAGREPIRVTFAFPIRLEVASSPSAQRKVTSVRKASDGPSRSICCRKFPYLSTVDRLAARLSPSSPRRFFLEQAVA